MYVAPAVVVCFPSRGAPGQRDACRRTTCSAYGCGWNRPAPSTPLYFPIWTFYFRCSVAVTSRVDWACYLRHSSISRSWVTSRPVSGGHVRSAPHATLQYRRPGSVPRGHVESLSLPGGGGGGGGGGKVWRVWRVWRRGVRRGWVAASQSCLQPAQMELLPWGSSSHRPQIRPTKRPSQSIPFPRTPISSCWVTIVNPFPPASPEEPGDWGDWGSVWCVHIFTRVPTSSSQGRGVLDRPSKFLLSVTWFSSDRPSHLLP